MLEFACVGGNPDIVKLIQDNIPLQDGEFADEVYLVGFLTCSSISRNCVRVCSIMLMY